MKPLALILARAGSKGVPGKNVRPVAGHPCAAWTINDARQAECVERIVCSTDSAELQQLAISMGVDIIARPAELASDHATIDDAARHAVTALNDPTLDPIVILYANVPIRPQGVIDRAVETMMRTDADSVQSYSTVGKFHPWWMVRIAENGEVMPWEGDTLNHGVFRRQELPPAYVPDGAVLVVTRRALFLEIQGVKPGPHAFFGRNRRAIINPPGSVVDIDEDLDLLVAEAQLLGFGAEQRLQ